MARCKRYRFAYGATVKGNANCEVVSIAYDEMKARKIENKIKRTIYNACNLKKELSKKLFSQ